MAKKIKITKKLIKSIKQSARNSNDDELLALCNSHNILHDALEAADLSLNECVKHLLGTGPIPDPDAIAFTVIEVKQALKESNG